MKSASNFAHNDTVIVKTADLIIAVLRRLGRLSIPNAKFEYSIPDYLDYKKDYIEAKTYDKVQNLEAVLDSIRYKLNSIIYGVFVFAISIVVILLMMLLNIF